MPRNVRLDVGDRAKGGLRHPDPETAATAEKWARSFFAAGWWNRAPGWLLPSTGVAIAVADWFITPWLALGGVIVAALGLLGWSVRRVAEQIIQVSAGTEDSPADES